MPRRITYAIGVIFLLLIIIGIVIGILYAVGVLGKKHTSSLPSGPIIGPGGTQGGLTPVGPGGSQWHPFGPMGKKQLFGPGGKGPKGMPVKISVPSAFLDVSTLNWTLDIMTEMPNGMTIPNVNVYAIVKISDTSVGTITYQGLDWIPPEGGPLVMTGPASVNVNNPPKSIITAGSYEVTSWYIDSNGNRIVTPFVNGPVTINNS